ncbi:lipase family protein [Roseateles sp.]|uniref:lipase family protein n=1 Tax=Roseateles sp. TaxID=1971397 RepID=UPI0039ED1CD1
MRLSSFLHALLSAALASAALAVTAQTRAPQPDPAQGDGRLSDFYRWAEAVPATPGQLLRSEPLPAQLGLSEAARQTRILYSSTSGFDSKTPIIVSGAVFIPKGTPPAGGWPVLAWGHGTVGLADICAPSWAGRSLRDVRYLNRWLKEGFAIVASDYEGLGVAGPHPLINVPMLAFGILDSARAAIRSVPGLANKVLLVGQSQGGIGVFAAAAYQTRYAPDLGVKGTVATGVIYRDPKATPIPLQSDPNRVDESLAYGFYGFLVDQQHDPSLKPEEVFTEQGLALLNQARVACLSTLASDVVGNGLTIANSRLAEPGPGYKRYQAGAAERSARYSQYPTLAIPHPVFIGTGANDVTPSAISQLALMRDACAAGTTVEGHLYAGLGHSATVNASLRDSVPFAKKVINDQPVAPVCAPSLQ